MRSFGFLFVFKSLVPLDEEPLFDESEEDSRHSMTKLINFSYCSCALECHEDVDEGKISAAVECRKVWLCLFSSGKRRERKTFFLPSDE